MKFKSLIFSILLSIIFNEQLFASSLNDRNFYKPIDIIEEVSEKRNNDSYFFTDRGYRKYYSYIEFLEKNKFRYKDFSENFNSTREITYYIKNGQILKVLFYIKNRKWFINYIELGSKKLSSKTETIKHFSNGLHMTQEGLDFFEFQDIWNRNNPKKKIKRIKIYKANVSDLYILKGKSRYNLSFYFEKYPNFTWKIYDIKWSKSYDKQIGTTNRNDAKSIFLSRSMLPTIEGNYTTSYSDKKPGMIISPKEDNIVNRIVCYNNKQYRHIEIQFMFLEDVKDDFFKSFNLERKILTLELDSRSAKIILNNCKNFSIEEIGGSTKKTKINLSKLGKKIKEYQYETTGFREKTLYLGY